MAAICEESERRKCKDNKNKTVLLVMMAGMIFVAAVLLISNWWFVDSARRATGEAIDSLSRFYLKEMARRSSEAISNSLEQKAGGGGRKRPARSRRYCPAGWKATQTWKKRRPGCAKKFPG